MIRIYLFILRESAARYCFLPAFQLFVVDPIFGFINHGIFGIVLKRYVLFHAASNTKRRQSQKTQEGQRNICVFNQK